jgi:uncharacterized membrane protein YgdD (TMEM256/DUF423 family)
MVSGLLGASGVALGAIAAHALTNSQASIAVERASTYQIIHAVAILLIAQLAGRTATLARWLVLFGVVGFSGGIYAKYLAGLTSWGQLAPVGGMLLIVAWLVLAVSYFLPMMAPDES